MLEAVEICLVKSSFRVIFDHAILSLRTAMMDVTFSTFISLPF